MGIRAKTRACCVCVRRHSKSLEETIIGLLHSAFMDDGQPLNLLAIMMKKPWRVCQCRFPFPFACRLQFTGQSTPAPNPSPCTTAGKATINGRIDDQSLRCFIFDGGTFFFLYLALGMKTKSEEEKKKNSWLMRKGQYGHYSKFSAVSRTSPGDATCLGASRSTGSQHASAERPHMAERAGWGSVIV
jgi:hypothetical protein